ncbi:hypothetical protein NPIL_279151, partial [Nephila pilipes]
LSHLYVQEMPEMHIWLKVWGLWQSYKSSGRKSLVLMTDTTKLISPYFPGKLEKNYYKNVMQSVGFQEVRSEIINIPLVYRNDEICLNELLQITKGISKIPRKRKVEFELDLLDSFKNIICSKSEPVCYTIVGLLLFAVKPSISLSSENESESS